VSVVICMWLLLCLYVCMCAAGSACSCARTHTFHTHKHTRKQNYYDRLLLHAHTNTQALLLADARDVAFSTHTNSHIHIRISYLRIHTRLSFLTLKLYHKQAFSCTRRRNDSKSNAHHQIHTYITSQVHTITGPKYTCSHSCAYKRLAFTHWQ
jgi:hypothetical protein